VRSGAFDHGRRTGAQNPLQSFEAGVQVHKGRVGSRGGYRQYGRDRVGEPPCMEDGGETRCMT
jgi:hypothetical protein